MSIEGYPFRANAPDAYLHPVTAEGGSSAITKVYGPGVAVSRTGTGAYRLTWSESPGTYVAALATLRAATPGDLAGHTVVFDEYDATNLRLDLVVYNASFAAHDLAADEYFDLAVIFKTTAV